MRLGGCRGLWMAWGQGAYGRPAHSQSGPNGELQYVCRHMVGGAGWGRAAEVTPGLPAASHSLVGMHHHAHFTDKVR